METYNFITSARVHLIKGEAQLIKAGKSRMALRNLILITIDCLRADQVGFGHERGRSITPILDSLAAEGFVFKCAFSCGVRTAESFPAILTSSYPLMYNIDSHHLSPKRLSIATVLQRSGFVTAAMHSSPILSAQYNYDRGFNYFWDAFESTDRMYRLGVKLSRRLRYLDRLYHLLRQAYHRLVVVRNKPPFARSEALFHRAREWLLRHNSKQRFFLWLHLMDLHNPYLPLRAYQARFFPKPLSQRRIFNLTMRAMDKPDALSDEEISILRLLYQAQVHYVDDKLGEFLAELRKAALMDDTLIVVTADHGEEFGEHGDVGHGAFVHRIHEGRVLVKLYDELLHVPLILHASGSSWAHRSTSELVSLLDLAPTLIELLGLPPVPEWQGESLVPLMEGIRQEGREGVWAEYEVKGENGLRGAVVAYRTREWKFIYDGLFGRHELYELLKDPQERANVAALYPAIVCQMQRVVEEHLSSLEPDSTTVLARDHEDDKLLQRLRALGYIE